MGWQDAPVVGESWQDAPVIEDEKKPKRTAGEELARQGGLTARYALEGPMQLLNATIGDPINTAINYGIRGVNSLIPRKLSSLITGQHGIPELGMPSQATQRGLDQVFPSPEGGTEQVVGAISKGMAGGGPTTALAMRAAPAIASLPFVKAIAGAPVVDLASQGVGAGASELAKQGGLGPAWQLAAGALAPMGVSGVAGAAKMAASIPNELRRPLTRGGTEQIAADVIGRMTQNKDRSLANLSRYNTLLARGEQVGSPGFKPTAAAVAGDYGLAGGQQLLTRGDAMPTFAEQMARNNEATATDLGRLNATSAAVEMYKNKRDTITAPLREKAFAGQTAPVDYMPVANKIAELAKTPEGMRAESQRALEWLSQRLVKYTDEGATGAEFAYGLHKDIGDLVGKKIATDKGPLMLAGGIANDVKKELASQIEAVTPGFKNYLEHYSRLSKPIERLEILTKHLGDQGLAKTSGAKTQVTDSGGTYTISQAKLRNQKAAIEKELSDKGLRLAGPQRDVLERSLADLNAETFAATAGKAPGSDTYQNMASANFMSRILGDTLGASGVAKAAAGPLNLAFKPLESRINDAIVQAFQDPKKMEELLRKARASRFGVPSLTGIAEYSAPRLSGGLLGSIIQ